MYKSVQLLGRRLQHQHHQMLMLGSQQQRLFGYQTELFRPGARFGPEEDQRLSEELRRVSKLRHANAQLFNYVKAYHEYGVRVAKVNPLETTEEATELPYELKPETYGLKENSSYSIDGLLFNNNNNNNQTMSLSEIEQYLKSIYSSRMAIEFSFIDNEEEKLWIAREFEQLYSMQIDKQIKVDLLKLLVKSQVFDHFLASKFPTFKRYSLEGGESSMAFYYSVFSNLAKSDIEDLVMGIAHRGRLNLMMCMLDLNPVQFFAKIKGKSEFASSVTATGDISHHFPCSTDLTYGEKKIHVSLLPNPSHLEAVDPLVLGKARSKQMFRRDGLYSDTPSLTSSKVASFLVHGDAAFAGQGIVPETFQLSRLPSYAVGGTIHLLTNNQIGFTTPSSLGRSGKFNTDLAKAFNCPIIHVNGDEPELAYKAGKFAVDYRAKFGKDVVVDIVCFRKYGHNELDDPSFTNPLMYKKIGARVSVPDLYTSKQLADVTVDKSELQRETSQFKSMLEGALDKVNKGEYSFEERNTYLKKSWSTMNVASYTDRTYWSTGCSLDLLKYIGVKSVTYPSDFAIHPTIERSHVKRRLEKMNDGKGVDWSTAEALAFGSLLTQGFNVRISGQDVGRGTFSQRHGMLYDQNTNKTYIPLNHLDEKGQKHFFEVCSSNLSEEAVMGFDYGFSLDHPNNLVIWEAQFGDFFNGAQIILDTYVASGEEKWMHQSGLVLLLPHGFDGAGPEHSSCRIERFLQSSSSREDSVDSDNINYYIAHPTTPANYFHLLRRQMLQPFRKPLIVASPKLLIRLPECVSELSELGPETRFQPVIDDPTVKSKSDIKRVIFVFGKHYYALQAEKAKRGANDVAIIRVEELSPFPAHELRQVVNEYKSAKEFVWAQEEHRNMGGWFFASPRFQNLLGLRLKYAGRQVHSTVAGTGTVHAQEVKHVLNAPFEKL